MSDVVFTPILKSKRGESKAVENLDDATKLRTAKARIKELERSLSEAEKQRLAYRTRATQAEQEAAQWKQRFDTLLIITKDGPKPAAIPPEGGERKGEKRTESEKEV